MLFSTVKGRFQQKDKCLQPFFMVVLKLNCFIIFLIKKCNVLLALTLLTTVKQVKTLLKEIEL